MDQLGSKCSDPVQWCRDMADKAKDSDEAYNYYQLAEMYENKSKE